MNILKKQFLIAAMLLASTANAEQPSNHATTNLNKMASSCSTASAAEPPCPATASLGMSIRKQLNKKIVLISTASAAEPVCPQAQAIFAKLLPFAEQIAGKRIDVILTSTDADRAENLGGGGAALYRHGVDGGPDHIAVSEALCAAPAELQRPALAHELGHGINQQTIAEVDYVNLNGDLMLKPWQARPTEIAATARAIEIYQLAVTARIRNWPCSHSTPFSARINCK